MKISNWKRRVSTSIPPVKVTDQTDFHWHIKLLQQQLIVHFFLFSHEIHPEVIVNTLKIAKCPLFMENTNLTTSQEIVGQKSYSVPDRSLWKTPSLAEEEGEYCLTSLLPGWHQAVGEQLISQAALWRDMGKPEGLAKRRLWDRPHEVQQETSIPGAEWPPCTGATWGLSDWGAALPGRIWGFWLTSWTWASHLPMLCWRPTTDWAVWARV